MSKEASEDQSVHWTDVAAEKVIREKGDKNDLFASCGDAPRNWAISSLEIRVSTRCRSVCK